MYGIHTAEGMNFFIDFFAMDGYDYNNNISINSSSFLKDTLRPPPSETQTMKKASKIAICIILAFYILLGGFGYAAFGDKTPNIIFSAFDNPRWLILLANTCIVLHLLGGYQVFLIYFVFPCISA